MFEETHPAANTSAPDPKSSIPASAGDTSNMPVGDLQPPAAPAPAQPPIQLQPSQVPTQQPVQEDQTPGQFLKKISHSFFGAVAAALASPSPKQVVDGYDTDESGKQTPRIRTLTNTDRMQRVALAALQGLAAGSQVPQQKSGAASALAGIGAGATSQINEQRQQDLLQRQQAKEQFEQEQKALTQKYQVAHWNAQTAVEIENAKKLGEEAMRPLQKHPRFDGRCQGRRPRCYGAHHQRSPSDFGR